MVGSISDTPPSGPSVPQNMPIEDILDLLWQSQLAYNDAKGAYETQRTAFNAARAAADAAYQSYLNDPSQLGAYITKVEALELLKDPLKATISQLHAAATLYVTHLAYQQIYYAQTGDASITSALESILSETPPQAPGEHIPALPWLTTSQIDVLKAISEAAPGIDPQLKIVLQDLLTKFLVYRNNQWQMAQAMHTIMELDAELALLDHQLHLAEAGVAGYDPSSLQSAHDTASDEREQASADFVAASTAATGIITALDNAISAYATMLATVKNLGTPPPGVDTTVQAVISFCQNWVTNVVDPAKAAITGELQQAITDVENFNQHLIDNFNREFAALNPEKTSVALSLFLAQLAAVQSSLTKQGVYLVSSIGTPTLPAPGTSMSMMEFMHILGQSELASEELIRLAATAEHQVTARRLQFALNHLMLFSHEISAFEALVNAMLNAQRAFNEAIQEENQLAYATAYQTYMTYNNTLDVINGTINSVNDEINRQAQALVDAANQIDPAVILATFYATISKEEAPNYLIDHLPPSGVTPPTTTPLDFVLIPQFEEIEADDLSDFPSPYSDGKLPERYSAIDMAVIQQFNEKIETVLEKIAPYKDIVENALKAELGLGDEDPPPALFQVLLKSSLPVEEVMQQRGVFLSSFVLLQTFTSQRVLASMSSEQEKASTQDLLDQLYQMFGLFGGGSVLAATAEFNAALTQVTNSSIFLTAIQQIVERAAILAGLQVAGTLPDILKQLEERNMTLAELFEHERQKEGSEIEAQTKSELMVALMQQLALAASAPGTLSQNVIDMLMNFPSLSSLSAEAQKDLLSGLVAIQQILLLTLTTALGVNMGLTPGQIATAIFGSADASTADIISRFMGLGIPQARAIELAAMVVGYDELDTLLTALGFDATTRTMLMAIIASAQGLIPLTDGAPGGPAFLDAMLSALHDQGITMTVDIFSPDFLGQLVAQLERKATESQRDTLRRMLLQGQPTPSPVVTSAISPTTGDVVVSVMTAEPRGVLFQRVADALQELQDKIKEIFAEPSPPQPKPTVVSPVKPLAIVAQFVKLYAPLAPEAKEELLAAARAEPTLAGISGISDEEKASLLLGMRLGLVTANEAAALMMLAVREAQALAAGAELKLSDLETALISRLFTPTPEELRKREEERRREINLPYIAPSTLPPQVLDQVSIAFRKFFNDFADANKAAKAYRAFVETIQRLHDFNSVAVDFLLAPAMIIMRQFSIITRTPQDRMQQSQITLTG